MKRLSLYTSNRLEILAEMLAEVLTSHLSLPLCPEIIVVQSKGMERWVSMQLAGKHGICANLSFPFPNAFLYEYIFKKILPDLPESSPFDPDVMAWKIMRLLPSLMPDPVFEHLKNYLGDGNTGLKAYQLSTRIADVFDQYLLFRPDWIPAWETSGEAGWQPALWRKLSRGEKPLHRAALGKQVNEILKTCPDAAQGLPERISVFGISTLPRFHMEALDALSEHRAVNLFLLNPCADYWGDVMTRQEKRRILRWGKTRGLPETDLHMGQGNRLLETLGILGRDFFDLINEFSADETRYFENPGEANMLACLQTDILTRQNRPLDYADIKIVSPQDTSVRIHSCHSPMREIEVLHDHLLDLFETDPALRPGDILVMAPDIEIYAPYIQAVFDVPLDDGRRIPFSIADRGIRKESRIIDAFLSILDLAAGRFGAAQALSILENPAIYGNFGMDAADLERIYEWVREVRIRWGIDAADRSRMGLPKISENTWRAGLDRLLLGYALTGGDNLFNGTLPHDGIEGEETLLLGRFAEFAERLFSCRESLLRIHDLPGWRNVLEKILTDFFHPDEDTEHEIQTIRGVLNDLAQMRNRAEFEEKTDLAVIKCHLTNQLQKDPFGFGFISGGVTFCAMLPMRSIPFKVICLIGMNSDDYPRQSRPPGFDLMTQKPRRGDRSRRNDDRYLFLEAILSAREKLYISYVGQSIRDNSRMPPSVLVSELMDVIIHGFKLPNGGKIIEELLLVRHRLQAFSPVYFGQKPTLEKDEPESKNRLFSFSPKNLRAAQRLISPRKKAGDFIARGLSEPGEEWKTLNIETLCAFFKNPAGFLLNRRLDIYFETEADLIDETEAFDLKGLDGYRLAHDLTEKRLAGQELKHMLPVKRSAGELPHGAVGEYAFDRASNKVEAFAKKLIPYLKSEPCAPLRIDLELGGFKITGGIHGLFREGLVRWRPGDIKPGDSLTGWIYHLILNAEARPGYPLSTFIAGTDAFWKFLPVNNCRDVLKKLLNLYWRGLRSPLCFFPRSAWDYAGYAAKGKSPDECLRNALAQWNGGSSRGLTGEKQDPYYRCCFRGDDPINHEFQELAIEIFNPLLNCREMLSGSPHP
jgi:exodeoxyribonuclease V gamma subunit